MRRQRAFRNILASIGLQAVTIVSGLIIPRLLISHFGSDVNGLVASINQFLSYIVLLEAGVGGVVRAALYKPLAKKDNRSYSAILLATERFFRIIGFTFLGYIAVLSFVLPNLVSESFSTLYTASLLVIIGMSTFFQYFFGLTYSMLLQSDQKKYIHDVIQIVTMLINVVLVVGLIRFGYGIHMVRLGSSLIYITRPLAINYYVKKKYNLVKDVEPDNKAISQRWDGLGHHIAYLLHNNTDITLITIFSTVAEVSVYSVYYMVVQSIRKIVNIISQSVEAAFGNMLANNEQENLNRYFNMYEFLTFFISTVLFSTTAVLILSFVRIYTGGVTDADYYRPVFAIILIMAEAIFCLRMPATSIISAAGHYRQTRNIAFGEALVNIVASLILINTWGLSGIAFGTFLAMSFRTVRYVYYLSQNILHRKVWVFLKKIVIFGLASCLIFVIGQQLPLARIETFVHWVLIAVVVTLISGAITLAAAFAFYRNELKDVTSIVLKTVYKRK